ncbi:MAG TPA: hypothetical protein VFQ80_17570, partial [Thermomicrobiales bacterium]|nr:hypothetical protein [Thermomicrobiales bacterium]
LTLLAAASSLPRGGLAANAASRRLALQQPCAKSKGCCHSAKGTIACKLGNASIGVKTCCGLAKTSCASSSDCCFGYGCDRDRKRCVKCRQSGGSCVSGGGTFDGALCCSLVCSLETGCGAACKSQRDCAANEQCCSWQASYPGYPYGYCGVTC